MLSATGVGDVLMVLVFCELADLSIHGMLSVLLSV